MKLVQIDLNKIYCYVVVLIWPLNMYMIGEIGLGTAINLVFVVCYVSKTLSYFWRSGKLIIRKKAGLLFTYLLVQSIVFTCIYKYDIAFLLKWIQYLSYIIILVLFLPDLTDTRRIRRFLCSFSAAASVFALVQFCAYHLFGYWISGQILQNLLPIADSEYLIHNSGFRPTSIFDEPSHYAEYALLGFIVGVDGEDIFSPKIKNIVLALNIVGLMLCGSNVGYIGLAGYAVLKFMEVSKTKKISKWWMLAVACGILFVGAILTWTGMGNYVASRFSGAYRGRMSGYGLIEQEMKGGFWFGRGMLTSAYRIVIQGWGLILIYFGWVGVLVYFLYFFNLYHRGDKCSRHLIIIIVMLGFGSTNIVGPLMILYYALMADNKGEICKNGKH